MLIWKSRRWVGGLEGDRNQRGRVSRATTFPKLGPRAQECSDSATPEGLDLPFLASNSMQLFASSHLRHCTITLLYSTTSTL